MPKRPPPSEGPANPALTHHPFAKLAGQAELASKHAAQRPAAPAPQPTAPFRASNVRFHLETVGRSGKVVTRMTGLPPVVLSAVASRLRQSLGCQVTIDRDHLLLHGSLVERASAWLERAGDLRSLANEPRPARAVALAAPEPVVRAGASGNRRADVRPGQRVAIVMKADQDTGKLTEGVVRALLTSSEFHPRGIKVRLESGEVGRVKIIYD
jgi:uncharacterized repeat protein (TIGR03833 family)